MPKNIDSPFVDYCKVGGPQPSGSVRSNGEAGLPSRTSSPNALDEVNRCNISGEKVRKNPFTPKYS